MKKTPLKIIETADGKFAVALVDDAQNVWEYAIFDDEKSADIAAEFVFKVLHRQFFCHNFDNFITLDDLCKALQA